MVLGDLHRHRPVPAAAALVGVLLYTALVTYHTVSQVRLQLGDAKVEDAPESGCHESSAQSNTPKTSDPGAPASPQRKCPFCSGYAILHIAFVGSAPGYILLVETVVPLLHSFDQDFMGRPARTPQNRGPPFQLA